MPELRAAGPTAANIWDQVLTSDTTQDSPGSGISRVNTKTITFTGASGLGLHGTATICFTVTGLIIVEFIGARATTNLTGATATITLGTTQQTTKFIGTTTATGLVTTAEIWISTTPTAGALALPAAMTNIVIDENVILSSTHASADVTGGVVEIDMIWRPLTNTATVT